MIRLIITLISPVLFLLAAAATQAATPYDTFPGPNIDQNKWVGRTWGNQGLMEVREVSQGKFVSKLRGTTEEGGMLLNQLAFADPNGITSLSAKVCIVEGEIDPDLAQSTWSIGSQLEGLFYEESSGSVWAGMNLNLINNGLSASYGVYALSGGNGDMFQLPISANIEYTLTLAYDETANEFTFTISNGTDTETHTLQGPDRIGPPTAEFKALTTGIWGTGGTTIAGGYIKATFDDVFVNGSLYEDFSEDSLVAGKWDNGEVVREVRDGQLQMNVQNFGNSEETNDIYMNFDQATDYIRADVNIGSDTVLQGDDTVCDARIYGIFSNNGDYKDIFAMARVKQYSDGHFRPYAYVFRCADTECEAVEDLFSEDFTCQVEANKPVTLSIEKIEGTLYFSCDNSHVTYELPTPIYLPESNIRKLRTRVYSASGQYGYAHVTFDNIYVSKGTPWNLFLPAILTSSGSGSD